MGIRAGLELVWGGGSLGIRVGLGLQFREG